MANRLPERPSPQRLVCMGVPPRLEPRPVPAVRRRAPDWEPATEQCVAKSRRRAEFVENKPVFHGMLANQIDVFADRVEVVSILDLPSG